MKIIVCHFILSERPCDTVTFSLHCHFSISTEWVNCSFSNQSNPPLILILLWACFNWNRRSIKLNSLCQQLISFYSIPFRLIWFHWIAHDWMTWFRFTLSHFACNLEKKKKRKMKKTRINWARQCPMEICSRLNHLT